MRKDFPVQGLGFPLPTLKEDVTALRRGPPGYAARTLGQDVLRQQHRFRIPTERPHHSMDKIDRQHLSWSEYRSASLPHGSDVMLRDEGFLAGSVDQKRLMQLELQVLADFDSALHACGSPIS